MSKKKHAGGGGGRMSMGQVRLSDWWKLGFWHSCGIGAKMFFFLNTFWTKKVMEVDGFFADFPDFNRVILRWTFSMIMGVPSWLDWTLPLPREDSTHFLFFKLALTSLRQTPVSLDGARNSWGAYVVGADPLSDIAVLQVKDEASVRDPAKWHEIQSVVDSSFIDVMLIGLGWVSLYSRQCMFKVFGQIHEHHR